MITILHLVLIICSISIIAGLLLALKVCFVEFYKNNHMIYLHWVFVILITIFGASGVIAHYI